MRVLTLYNIATTTQKGTDRDPLGEQETKRIIPRVVELLKAKGYKVDTLDTTFTLWEDLKSRKSTFDIVLNLAEGFCGSDKHEVLVPTMLEALEIPFTGASSHNMLLTLDKEKTKHVVQAYGIPTPEYQVFRHGSEVLAAGLRYPLIVKPIRQGGSIGIHLDSVVTDEFSLHRKVYETLTLFREPVIVEAFVEGREVSVGVVGNSCDLHVFPPLEFLFADAESPLEQIRSYECKWGGKIEQMIPAELPLEMGQRLSRYAQTAFVATDCRDYARMDFRVRNDGSACLLEVNYNPAIGPNTSLTQMASFEGLGFGDLIECILLTAAKREGILLQQASR